MANQVNIATLNRKRGNIKGQLTKMAGDLQTHTDFSVPELQANLDVFLKLQDRFELLKDDYYKIDDEKLYTEALTGLNSVEDILQNLEVSLKASINQSKCDSDKRKCNADQQKATPVKLPEIPLPIFTGKIGWLVGLLGFYGAWLKTEHSAPDTRPN